MKRRELLRWAAISPFLTRVPSAFAQGESREQPWRIFEMTYEVDLTQHKGAGKVWLPIPQTLGDYQRLVALSWNGAPPGADLKRERTYGANMFSLTWDEKKTAPRFSVTAKVATRDRRVEVNKSHSRDEEEARLYLQPTEHMPVDGIVAETSQSIVKASMTPDEKARAIYEWVVDNTFREPKVRGCGLGNIKAMLETGNLGGKCADINSLFVGLARAAGIPAREVYGVRVAPSKQLKCLGANGDISTAQHCRAEYLSPIHGWVAVDPADVRKAVLQENLALDHPRIKTLREYLFGNWEMNWVGFNTARDFKLDDDSPVQYLMYPYARIADDVFDGRSPEEFKFKLNSIELT